MKKVLMFLFISIQTLGFSQSESYCDSLLADFFTTAKVLNGCNNTVSGSYSCINFSLYCTLENNNSYIVNCINVHVIGKGTPVSIAGKENLEFRFCQASKEWISKKIKLIEGNKIEECKSLLRR